MLVYGFVSPVKKLCSAVFNINIIGKGFVSQD